jgi:phosphoenolpyruvate-protein kinase (PTS system EI component)
MSAVAAVLRGVPGAPGVAVASACVLREREPERGMGGHGEQDRALGALERTAAELEHEAGRLRAEGLAAEAEILEANALMARDPVLAADVRLAAAQCSAAAALRDAADRHADALGALPDPMLAARADDVRQLGRRAARLLTAPVPTTDAGRGRIVLVARDLGPADVAELRGDTRVVGLALAAGAVTSHAAIMARSLGLPMVVDLGDGVLEADGETLVLDGDAGTATVAPGAAELVRARAAIRRQLALTRRRAGRRHLPAVTPDGRAIRLLCNAATLVELDAGLAGGAEGAGLIRTELAFLTARDWPGETDHRRVLEPLLARLAGRVATVRTLDFGEDKTPPFLRSEGPRGTALMLAHPSALAAQLRAVVAAGGETRLRILLPMVESAEQVRAVRSLLGPAAPPLGAMIETPTGSARADEIAATCDFLSIGTNDLVQYTVGLDRGRAVSVAEAASDPVVLRHVAAVCRSAARAGIPVEVCGEAAGEPLLAALLVGLGVDELSVAPARLDELRELVRSLPFESAAATAAAALEASSADEVRSLAGRLLSGQRADDGREAVHGLGGPFA